MRRGECKLRDFIDKTSVENGTPINRDYLMALQGFDAISTVFKSDGGIIETNSKGETLTTVFETDGSITETFVGAKTITKKTTFDASGNILEEVLQ